MMINFYSNYTKTKSIFIFKDLNELAKSVYINLYLTKKIYIL